MKLFSVQQRRIPRARFFGPWLRRWGDDIVAGVGFVIFAWVCVYVLPVLTTIDRERLCATIGNILACHR